MPDFDVVWQRIVGLQGEAFRQKTGRSFRYRVSGNSVVPDTTNRMLPRSQFERAFDRAPLRGPGQLQDLQGPSYLYAILTDPRIAADLTAWVAAADPHERPMVLSAGRDEPTARAVPQASARWLRQVDPRQVLLVIACSAAKVRGGQPPLPGWQEHEVWPEPMLAARAQVLAGAPSDVHQVLPAWQRYAGTFYRHCGPALAEASANGNVVIISGGYGLVGAQEPIGWYDKVLRLADWPPGVLESALISRARQAGDTVIAFASRSTGYAHLLRRTPWRAAGLRAGLVTVTGVTAGAMGEVPRRLGLAFALFWRQQHGGYPPGTALEQLS